MERLSWSMVDPKSTYRLIREKIWQREEKEAEIGVKLSQAKSTSSHQKQKMERNRFPPSASRGSVDLLTPWIWPDNNNFAFMVSKTEIFFKPPNLWQFVTANIRKKLHPFLTNVEPETQRG